MWSGVAGCRRNISPLSSPLLLHSFLAPRWPRREQRADVSQQLGLEPGCEMSLNYTIFIKNVPPTVDNGHNLMAFVPGDGLVTLRVRQTGGRNIGFVEYSTAEAAYEALQWFYKLEMTAKIVISCLVEPQATWKAVPLEVRYPVPYDEYNHCANDPNRLTELLLNSVILLADWSTGSPNCRPRVFSVSNPSFTHRPVKGHITSAATEKSVPYHTHNETKDGLFPPSASSLNIGTTPTLSQKLAAKMRTSLCLHDQQPSNLKMPFINAGPSTTGAKCQLSRVGPIQTIVSDKNYQNQCFKKRCCRDRRNNENFSFIEMASKTAAFLTTEFGEQVQKASLGSAFSSILLNDADLPSSTLFVKVICCFWHCNCGSTPFFGKPTFSSIESETDEGKAEEDEGDDRGALANLDVRQLKEQKRIQKQHSRECVNSSMHGWLNCNNHRYNFELWRRNSGQSPGDAGAQVAALKSPQVATALQELQPPSLLLPADGNGVSAVIAKMILNRDFFFERFAGVCSFVSYTKCSGFVRFERPGDARQCLRWLGRQEALRPWVTVQFARQDTRACRLH